MGIFNKQGFVLSAKVGVNLLRWLPKNLHSSEMFLGVGICRIAKTSGLIPVTALRIKLDLRELVSSLKKLWH